MRRRIMAMLVAVTGLVVLSMSGDASPAAATAAAPTSAPSATAAAPTLYCAAGIAGQVCDAVLGPICQNRCLASTSATRTAAAPAFTCEPGLFATICQIVFAPFCTVHHCYAAA